MNLIFTNAKDHGKWNKDNYHKACMTLAAHVPIYKCAALPLPWISYFALSQSPIPSVFIPDEADFDLKTYVAADGSMNNALINLFEDFAKKIGIPELPFKDLAYEASFNIFDGKVDAAFWVGFDDKLPENAIGREFKKYIKAGKAFFLDIEKGTVEDFAPPWREPSNPHFTKINGDIFNGDWDYLVHCANTQHAMRSGIAAEISSRFPEAVAADNASPLGEDKLGTFTIGKNKFNKSIVNLYGQIGIGNDGHPLRRNARYDHIYNGLFLLFESIKMTDPNAEIAFPHGMCCGLAGGDWNVVESIIKSLQEKFAMRVSIYKFDGN